MKLIGRYLSPFTRRVGVALHLYDIEFAHDPLSSADDREAVNVISQIARIPCLILDSGETLVDSHQILAELDRMVGPERALVPKDPSAARSHGQLIALCTGALEKCVAMMQEQSRRPEDKVWQDYADQCRNQAIGALTEAEAWASAQALDNGHLFGSERTHADVAAVLAVGVASMFFSDVVTHETFPKLQAVVDSFGKHPAFEHTSPF